jgi:AcrR family transcriptional regulator
MTISQYMKAKSKHLPKLRREQQIINAADNVLRNVGAYDFTIDRIVADLGVAKGTIYKYYKSKDDILAEVSVKALKLLLDYFKMSVENENDLLKATKALIMSCYQYYLSHPKYFELIIYMERPDFNSDIKDYLLISRELRNFFTEHIINCQLAGVIKKELNPTYCTYMIWGSCMGLMNFIEAKRVFIEDFEKIGRKELLKLYSDTLVAGMRP